MSKRESAYQDYLDIRQSQGLRRELMELEHIDAKRLRFEGREYLNFSGNDYLGLSRHEALARQAGEWSARYGAGAGASRLVTGNLKPFGALEDKLARFKCAEAALIMASGFQANATVLHALFSKTVLGAAPLILVDELVHASMHFGCWAARAAYRSYRHSDMAHLSELIETHRETGQPLFILSETVFSMDGDIAPVEELRAIADRHDGMLILDDAHGTGILGPGGRGLSSAADVAIGTFSKGMGSFGAYVTSSRTVRDYLVNRCSGLIYSTGLPPAVLGSIDAALDMVPGMGAERKRVMECAGQLRAGLKELGVDTGRSESQIVPVIVGAPEAALGLASALREAGIWATPIRPPTVPDGTARLRIAINAAHDGEDLDRLLSAIAGWRKHESAA